MGAFERVNYDKKNIITQDTLSIPGTVKKNQGVIPAGSVLAFDATGEWVKWVEATHKNNFALGILKEEATTTATDGVMAAILKVGIVNAKEVTLDSVQKNSLMIQGIVSL